MEKKMYCPFCGEELTSNGYNYDTGRVEYTCPSCERFCTDACALDDEENEQAERVYSALEAAEEQGYITSYSSRLEIDDNMFEILLFEFEENEIDDIDDKSIEAALHWYLI